MTLRPEIISDTCRAFTLSTLSANEDAKAWGFHLLLVWNSSYEATVHRGAFENIKMYLYQGGTERSTLASCSGAEGIRGGNERGRVVADWEVLFCSRMIVFPISQ